MSAVIEQRETTPVASWRLLGGLAATAIALGLLVYVDVLPRLDAPPPKVAGTPFLPPGVASTQRIDVTRGRKEFRLERSGSTWTILDRGERAPVPDDRVDQFLATLSELVVLVDIGPVGGVSLGDFGLAHPQGRVRLWLGDGRQIRILLGDRNPPLTGIYALVLAEERVVLVGAVLLLDVDELAALASAGAPANPPSQGTAAGGPP